MQYIQESATPKRETTYDIMKFFGIMMVIVGHMTIHFSSSIYSFHMPLFFILAGYFYHERDVRSELRSDAERLLLPYAFTAAAVFFAHAVLSLFKDDVDLWYWLVAALYGCGSTGHTSLYLSHVPVIGAIWFLLALFWCKTLFNIIHLHSKHWLLVSLLASCLAIIIDTRLVNLPFAFLPGAGALMFYAFGFLIRSKGGFLHVSPFLWALAIVCWGVSISISGMSMVRCYYHDFLINVIGALGGTYALFLVSSLVSTTRSMVTRLMIWAGQNSLTFLCIHLFDLDVPVREHFHVSAVVGIPLVIVACFAGTYVLGKIPITRRVFNIKSLETQQG